MAHLFSQNKFFFSKYTLWWACVQWLTINVKHHLPHGGTHWLVEAKPNFPSPTKWVVVSFRWGEKWSAHWCVPNQKGWRGGNQCSDSGHDRSMSSCLVMWMFQNRSPQEKQKTCNTQTRGLRKKAIFLWILYLWSNICGFMTSFWALSG